MKILILFLGLLSATAVDSLSVSEIVDQLVKYSSGYISKVLPIDTKFNASRDMFFVLHTPKTPTAGQIITADKANITNSYFNALYPTRILIHGWQNNSTSSMNFCLTSAYLFRGNFNIIVSDWGKGASDLDYLVARYRIQRVADEIAKLLRVLVAMNYTRLNDLIIIGHSLGAHTAGLVGKQVLNVGAIIGLDPAGPLFYLNNTSTRLANTDAKYVASVHTSMLAGITEDLSDADFRADGGFDQHGCFDTVCSHSRAPIYMCESIRGPNLFSSTPCSSLVPYELGFCKNNKKVLFGGEPLDKSLKGRYYFEVNKVAPYGMG